MNKYYCLFIIVILLILMIWSMCKAGANADSIKYDEDKPKKDKEVDVNLRQIQTYFFTNGLFDFSKFTDYILCINENMSLSDMANCLMELDLMMKCSPDLEKRLASILVYSNAIIGIDHKEFDEVKQALQDKKFTGTYQDLVYIYLTTVFYLKYQMAIKKG